MAERQHSPGRRVGVSVDGRLWQCCGSSLTDELVRLRVASGADHRQEDRKLGEEDGEEHGGADVL